MALIGAVGHVSFNATPRRPAGRSTGALLVEDRNAAPTCRLLDRC
jgi:hypothetical protein